MSQSPPLDLEKLNAQDLQTEQELRSRIDRAPHITEQERNWYYGVLDKKEVGMADRRDKVNFYLKAADTRSQIVLEAPLEHQEKVYRQVTAMLDSSIDRDAKPAILEAMMDALQAFWSVQTLIRRESRKIDFLPPGFEARIWGRFQKMYLEQDRDLLNPKSIAQFESSIGRTFDHLARIAQQQESLRGRLEQDKFFKTKDEKTGQSMQAVLMRQFESQMDHWLSADLSLRDWAKAFNDLTEKQMPAKLKAFNQAYNQVYTPSFWALQSRFNPQFFPHFTTAFNFATEADFLHHKSLAEIKKQTQSVYKALQKEAQEIGGHFINDTAKASWAKKIKNTKPNQIVGLMKQVLLMKDQRERNEQKALSMCKVILIFDRRRFVLEGIKAAEGMERAFGKNIFAFLGIQDLVDDLYTRKARIDKLKKELQAAKRYETQYEIQQQLLELEATFYFPDDSPGAREHKVAQLKEQFGIYKDTKNFRAARVVASKLKKYDAIEAYSLFKALEKEEAKSLAASSEPPVASEEEVKKIETPHDKLAKIRFFEGCIEHAKAVKQECQQHGIPVDNPDFWGLQGIKNRVQWLQDNGLYNLYKTRNKQDPNIPKDAQEGGFRFRWLDGRGADVSSAKAEDGMKYLKRYKESTYLLCALAGAFSINWKNSSDPTYTPDQFIDKMNEAKDQV